MSFSWFRHQPSPEASSAPAEPVVTSQPIAMKSMSTAEPPEEERETVQRLRGGSAAAASYLFLVAAAAKARPVHAPMDEERMSFPWFRSQPTPEGPPARPVRVTSQPRAMKTMSTAEPTQEDRQTAQRLRGGCIPCPVSAVG
ncbi:hypothetical protein DACRYDRAFT_103792 [Dacryopinax primogenitus]|uniref:Uncharacterized protein n=1 Tax=Dacryopinax primogenitus (strain DJM 731) TaxID=1858805 RepID=M5G967_DACPD|nr:uncharacterized protein DACRYDRAFT_103792 [Dacryopinax primogenitus]EJU05299.1 hypothetical protein DACRYDRAFT_103792 [Dacryopinax primogenitus]